MKNLSEMGNVELLELWVSKRKDLMITLMCESESFRHDPDEDLDEEDSTEVFQAKQQPFNVSLSEIEHELNQRSCIENYSVMSYS